MRSVGVVVDPPAFDEHFGFTQIIAAHPRQQVISMLAVKAVTVPAQGDPGLPLILPIDQPPRLSASGPWSERMWSVGASRTISSPCPSMTARDFGLLSTRIANRTRVNPSSMQSMRHTMAS